MKDMSGREKLFQVCDWTRQVPVLIACLPVVDELLAEGKNSKNKLGNFFVSKIQSDFKCFSST